MNPSTNAEIASGIVDCLMNDQRLEGSKPILSHRRRFDFNEWILELDEPSRTRLERFFDLAANAIALGKG
jgi:hypothetical protein